MCIGEDRRKLMVGTTERTNNQDTFTNLSLWCFHSANTLPIFVIGNYIFVQVHHHADDVSCFEDGVCTEKQKSTIEVERTDRFTIKGLDKNQYNQVNKPINFVIVEKDPENNTDITKSTVFSTSFRVEIRNPMGKPSTIFPKPKPQSKPSFSLADNKDEGPYEMEFTPEFEGVYKLCLIYKDVMVGDVIMVRVGLRRLGGHGNIVPSMENVSIGPVGVVQVSNVLSSPSSVGEQPKSSFLGRLFGY